ncbi:MAG: hypothetical protein IKQ39_05560 [Oscillospiraceae bacterium]|nr:hypothetical protein [Oscillospiraceae bacterium]
MKHKSLTAAILAVLASVSLTACSSDTASKAAPDVYDSSIAEKQESVSDAETVTEAGQSETEREPKTVIPESDPDHAMLVAAAALEGLQAKKTDKISPVSDWQDALLWNKYNLNGIAYENKRMFQRLYNKMFGDSDYEITECSITDCAEHPELCEVFNAYTEKHGGQTYGVNRREGEDYTALNSYFQQADRLYVVEAETVNSEGERIRPYLFVVQRGDEMQVNLGYAYSIFEASKESLENQVTQHARSVYNASYSSLIDLYAEDAADLGGVYTLKGTDFNISSAPSLSAPAFERFKFKVQGYFSEITEADRVAIVIGPETTQSGGSSLDTCTAAVVQECVYVDYITGEKKLLTGTYPNILPLDRQESISFEDAIQFAENGG